MAHEKKFTVELTAAEASALAHAAGNVMDTEDRKTQLEFFGSVSAYYAAWRAMDALRPLVRIHARRRLDKSLSTRRPRTEP